MAYQASLLLKGFLFSLAIIIIIIVQEKVPKILLLCVLHRHNKSMLIFLALPLSSCYGVRLPTKLCPRHAHYFRAWRVRVLARGRTDFSPPNLVLGQIKESQEKEARRKEITYKYMEEWEYYFIWLMCEHESNRNVSFLTRLSHILIHLQLGPTFIYSLWANGRGQVYKNAKDFFYAGPPNVWLVFSIISSSVAQSSLKNSQSLSRSS